MELFGNIRSRLGHRKLKKRASAVKRLSHDFSMERVSRIGILWDATVEDDFQYVAALNRKMADDKKSVEVLAWIPGKTVPDRLTGLAYMKFLRKSDLSFCHVPDSDDAERFIEAKHDLLIDINPNQLFPLKYITALSTSPMKVGLDTISGSETSPYDLMIQVKPFSTAHFIEQVIYYLEMISNPENRA